MDAADPARTITQGENVYQAALVVQNGRLAGARRPLNPALTLLGKSANCDIRLKGNGVAEFHCVILATPAGLILRDLGTASGTILNGDAAIAAPLRDGDLLGIGGFRFRISLAGEVPAPQTMGTACNLYDAAALEQEREALRIQAAGIAAQQAELIEKESRLEQREVALSKQETQLAAHFEQRKKEIADRHDQLRTERISLRIEHEEYQAKGGAELQMLERQRDELHRAHEIIEKRRRRVAMLHRRLRQRWHKHWDRERDGMLEREQALAKKQTQLEQQANALRKERETLLQAHLQASSETELARLRVQEEQQRQLEQRAEIQNLSLELDGRQRQLLEAGAAFEKEKRRVERHRANLEKEIHGLERRVSNLRVKLAEADAHWAVVQRKQHDAPTVCSIIPVTTESATTPAQTTTPSQPAAPDGDKRQELERLVAELADQRRLLAEESERLLRVDEAWQSERRQAEDALETLTAEIQEREQACVDSERALGGRWSDLEQREMRLQALQTRLAVKIENAEEDQSRLLDKVRAREAVVEKHMALLGELRQRWLAIRRTERERLKAEFQKAGQMRERHIRLWEECQIKLAGTLEAQKTLAERTLAIEQYRVELVGAAADAVAAERRLDILRRQEDQRLRSAVRQVEQDRKALRAERNKLDEQAHDAEAKHQDVQTRELELGERQTQWEQEQQAAEIAHARLQEALKSAHLQQRRYEQQIDALNAELERIINSMLQGEPQVPRLQLAKVA
jgi:hypothetical protein